jgi:hypothetical protein
LLDRLFAKRRESIEWALGFTRVGGNADSGGKECRGDEPR